MIALSIWPVFSVLGYGLIVGGALVMCAAAKLGDRQVIVYPDDDGGPAMAAQMFGAGTSEAGSLSGGRPRGDCAAAGTDRGSRCIR